jgi:hypothetical protein
MQRDARHHTDPPTAPSSVLHTDDSASEQASLERMRRRLQMQMRELSAAWERSWSFRLRRRLNRLPFTARLGGSAAVVALAVSLLAPMITRHQRARDGSANAALPNRTLTPGAVGNVALADVCAGRVTARSHISSVVRQAILRDYSMEHLDEGEYELDYLITPELGGTADPKNLWPERYNSGIWNAHVKDDLERLLPQLVCRGSVDLATAQRDIAENWIAAYQKYFATDRPLPRMAGTVNDDDDDVQVVAMRTELTPILAARR